MSYPHASGLQIAFYMGIALAAGFAVLYGCMLGGVIGETGYDRVMWTGVGASGILHVAAFLTIWIGSCCGCFRTRGGDGFICVLMCGVAVWLIAGLAPTILSSMSSDIVGILMYYFGVTTLIHVAVTVIAAALIVCLPNC